MGNGMSVEAPKIYVGMKVKDASADTKLMKEFNYADKNGDGEISEDEFSRYKGPTIFVSKGTTSLDYYPGLRIENVSPEGRVDFSKIDENKDGVLSQEEIERVKKGIEESKNFQKQLIEMRNKSNRKGYYILGGSMVTGFLAGAGVAALMGTPMAGAVIVGFCGTGLLGMGGMSGHLYGCNKYNKEVKKKINEYLESIPNDFTREQVRENLRKNADKIFIP